MKTLALALCLALAATATFGQCQTPTLILPKQEVKESRGMVIAFSALTMVTAYAAHQHDTRPMLAPLCGFLTLGATIKGDRAKRKAPVPL